MRTLEARYAMALFQLTHDEEGLRRGVESLTGDETLWQALNNPCISREEKDKVLCRLLEGEVGPALLNFFRLVCRRERFALLPAIEREYHLLALKAEGGAQAVYRCAREPEQGDLEKIGEALRKRHGLSKVEFHVVVDPELMGGFMVQLEGVTYDKSVRGMLRAMRRSLKERD